MNHRQKAKDLLELYADENTSKEERLTALVSAAKLIRKYDLLASPLDIFDTENETIQAVKSVADVFLDPTLQSNVKKIASRFGKRKRR